MKRGSRVRDHDHALPLLARAAEILRYEGAAGLWFRVLAVLGYRREGWFERSLRDPIAIREAGLPVVIEELQAADAQDYVAFRPGADAERFGERLERGCRCFAARLDGRILAATWTLEGGGWVEHLGRDLRLEDGEVYLFNAYTLSEARGHGLRGAISAAVLEDCRKRGFETAIALIEPHNLPSVRSCERSGYRRTGTIARVRIGPWRRELSWGRTDRRRGG
jgi:GNAT superfamily N-acetyltransferase